MFLGVMAWCQPADKPLSEAMMVYFTDSYMHHSYSVSYDMKPAENTKMNTTIEVSSA